MALDDAPETIRLRIIRRALIHQTVAAVRERAVDDIAVARYPADVGRAPEVSSLRSKTTWSSGCEEEIAGGRVENALRLRWCPK